LPDTEPYRSEMTN